MSTLETTTQGHLTTARVNGRPVVVHHAHRFAGDAYEPPLVTVLAPVALTEDEVTDLLFYWMTTGGTFGELDDDSTVRSFIADTVVNAGCLRLDDARATAAQAGVSEGLLEYCRQRARTVGAPTTMGEVAW